MEDLALVGFVLGFLILLRNLGFLVYHLVRRERDAVRFWLRSTGWTVLAVILLVTFATEGYGEHALVGVVAYGAGYKHGKRLNPSH